MTFNQRLALSPVAVFPAATELLALPRIVILK